MHPPSVVNLSGYRFVRLEHLPLLQADLERALEASGVLGTRAARRGRRQRGVGGQPLRLRGRHGAVFDADTRLAGLWLKESLSETVPFARLKVRQRREIIAFDGEGAVARQGGPPARPRRSRPSGCGDWLDGKSAS